jgi:hypothetical protein
MTWVALVEGLLPVTSFFGIVIIFTRITTPDPQAAPDAKRHRLAR